MLLIDLNDWGFECLLCGEDQPPGAKRWCVPFYEEPRPDLKIGQVVPGGGSADVVGGMTCCKACFDDNLRALEAMEGA